MFCVICNNNCYNFLNITKFNLYQCPNCFHVQSNFIQETTHFFSNKNNKNYTNYKNINLLNNPHEYFLNNKTNNNFMYIKCTMMADYFIPNFMFPYYYQKSYFTTNSLNHLCKKYNYKICNISKINEHTFLFKLKYKNLNENDNICTDLIDKQYQNISNNLYSDTIFTNYLLYFTIYKNKIQNILLKYHLCDYKIYYNIDHKFKSTKLIKILLNELLNINQNNKIQFTKNINIYTNFNDDNIYLNFHKNNNFNTIINCDKSDIVNINLFYNNIFFIK